MELTELYASNAPSLKASIVNLLYPIGSIYMTTNTVEPSELFGGEWEPFAQGRTIIGAGTSDKEFVAGTTGGCSNQTLTVAQMPSHTHTQQPHKHEGEVKNFKFWFAQFAHKDVKANADFLSTFKNSENTNVTLTELVSPKNNTASIGNGENWGYRKTQVSWTQTPNANTCTAVNNNAGGNEAHNNLQPYIVTYIWHRVG